MQQIVNSEPLAPSTPTPVKSGSNTTIIIAIVVVLIIGLAIGVAIWMKNRKAKLATNG